MTVTWEQLGYSAGDAAVVRDMFLRRDLGEYTGDASYHCTDASTICKPGRACSRSVLELHGASATCVQLHHVFVKS